MIHSDLQRGFIRAEVIDWRELLDIGSWDKAKELGKIRVEGKEYEVLDGDGMVLRTTCLRPWRVSPLVPNAAFAIEAQAGAFERWGLKTGDTVEVKE